MPTLCNTQKAELVLSHGVFWFILCFSISVILIQRVEICGLCFLQSMHRGFLIAPVHFLVRALAWQVGGALLSWQRGEKSSERNCYGLDCDTSYRRPSLPSWLGAVVAERRSTERKGGGPPIRKQQGLPGMGYLIFTDCRYFSLVMCTYVWQTSYSIEQRSEEQNTV